MRKLILLLALAFLGCGKKEAIEIKYNVLADPRASKGRQIQIDWMDKNGEMQQEIIDPEMGWSKTFRYSKNNVYYMEVREKISVAHMEAELWIGDRLVDRDEDLTPGTREFIVVSYN